MSSKSDDNDKFNSWAVKAKCKGTDPALFFPPTGKSTEDRARVFYAQCFCRGDYDWDGTGRCPVLEACLEYALATRQEIGVWGGTSEAQRRSILKKRKRS